ncbi:MAG: ATP-binding protein [Candidatus Limivivens sp.]|nr:ATP-binding protein [Candidatus Limivivens sp.]
MKGKTSRKNGYFKSYPGILGMLFLATLIIIASTLIFSQTAKKASDETTISLGHFYLEEIADRTVYEISSELERNKEQLQRAVEEMKNKDLKSDDSLRAYLAMIQRLNGFDIFAVVDEDGTVYTSDSTFSGITRFDFLSEPVTETTLYTTKTTHSRAMVLIAAPTEKISFGETHIVSCITGVDVDKIISAQQLQGVNNQVLCRLFDGDDGTCIVESEGRYADGSSISDVWRNDCSFSGEYSSEKLISDWNTRTEGYAYYTAREGSTYLYYMPVPDTNWIVSVRLRQNVIGAQIMESGSKTLRGSQIQLLVVILSMVAVFVFVLRQIRKTQSEQFAKEKEEELLRQEAKASEEKLRLQEKLLQEEKASSRQASVLQILSKEYSSVYYVDLEEDTAVPLRLSDTSSEFYGIKMDRTYSFREIYESYIQGFTAPDQLEELLRFSDPAFLRQTLKDDEILTYLYRIVRDGKELYAQLRIARVEDDANFRHIVLGFAIVDDAVRAEQKNQRVLKDALAQAERANQAKTTFLNNMSHDIRTPMNAIIGFTNIALKQDISPEVKNCLEKISESSDHLLTLINDVLDISRIESGKTKWNPIPIDLTTISDVVLDITHGFLSNRDITFDIRRINQEHLYVLADAVRIREVLVNILSNAVKFTDDGGRITFAADCRAGEDEKHVVITYRISDTGIGMSPDFLAHIFDEFSQEESSARTQYKGTGLGMAITRRYVELMGGTISVESEKGKGSTFVVELPMELTDESNVQKQDLPAATANLKGIKILLAEDNDLNAEIASIQLEDLEMTVTRAADGKEAVTLFLENPPGTFDVILMDIMMPVMNGYEAARAIRAMEDRRDAHTIPIIAMTANAFAEDIQESLNAGMNAHIAKPLKISRVTSEISRLVFQAGQAVKET